jgi:hypothetical protein
VGAWGWSHGGGETYNLMQELKRLQDLNLLTTPFTVDATAYMDGVRHQGLSPPLNFFSEDRKPILTNSHANWYQPHWAPFGGVSVSGSDIDTNLSTLLDPANVQDHVEIVVEVDDQQLLINFFEQEMSIR